MRPLDAQIVFDIPTKDKERLSRYAATHKVTVSALMRIVVSDFLATNANKKREKK